MSLSQPQPNQQPFIRNSPETNDDRERGDCCGQLQPSPSQTTWKRPTCLPCLLTHTSSPILPFSHSCIVWCEHTCTTRLLPLASGSLICDCPCRICRARSAFVPITRQEGTALQVMFLFFLQATRTNHFTVLINPCSAFKNVHACYSRDASLVHLFCFLLLSPAGSNQEHAYSLNKKEQRQRL